MKKIIESALHNIIGPNDPGLLLATFFFAVVGISLTLLMGTALRNPSSSGSPFRFSLSYLLSDNNKRILASLISVVVCIRFLPELFGMELKALYGLALGLSWDGLFLLIKQKTNFFDKKPQV